MPRPPSRTEGLAKASVGSVRSLRLLLAIMSPPPPPLPPTPGRLLRIHAVPLYATSHHSFTARSMSPPTLIVNAPGALRTTVNRIAVDRCRRSKDSPYDLRSAPYQSIARAHRRCGTIVTLAFP